MRLRLLSFRVRTLCLAILFTVISPAFAVEDLLKTPAMPSELAVKTLLLDAARAGNRIVAVGQRGDILYSDDEAQTWKQATVPVSATLTAVYFPTPTKGWAVGHSGVILHSDDSGQTWVKQFDGNLANRLVVEQNEALYKDLEQKVASAPAAEADALKTRLDDAQIAIEDAKADMEAGPVKPFLDVWFKDDKQGFAVGAYGMLFATTDGGVTWASKANRIDNPDRYHLNAINQITGGALFIVGEAGHIFMSTDLGTTWKTIQSPYDGSFFGVEGTGNVNEVIVMGLRGHLFRSDNLGTSWTAVPTREETNLMAACHDENGNVTVVGNSGVVLESHNFGQSFDSYVREDRDSMASVIRLKNNQLLMVGETGAKRTNLKGQDIQ